MITSAEIAKIEKKIGYSFRDKSLLLQAFTRESFCNEENRRSREEYQSYQVLEFFGDSVLSAAIVTNLIKAKSERYAHGVKTTLSEGDFSNIRSKLADKKNLSENISRLGLEKYFIMGEGDRKLHIEREPSVREDLFESVVGAVYIDSDFSMDAVMTCVSVMLDMSDYLRASAAPMQSYKNLLQEWCADKKRRMSPPVYEKTGESGPDHDKTYEVACYVDGRLLGRGAGRSVKIAETAAAKEALSALGVISKADAR